MYWTLSQYHEAPSQRWYCPMPSASALASARASGCKTQALQPAPHLCNHVFPRLPVRRPGDHWTSRYRVFLTLWYRCGLDLRTYGVSDSNVPSGVSRSPKSYNCYRSHCGPMNFSWLTFNFPAGPTKNRGRAALSGALRPPLTAGAGPVFSVTAMAWGERYGTRHPFGSGQRSC